MPSTVNTQISLYRCMNEPDFFFHFKDSWKVFAVMKYLMQRCAG